MRGVLSVITVAHHVVRRRMVVNDRIGEPVHCLRMSVRDAMPIKRKERLTAVNVVVVGILKDLLALFLEMLVVAVGYFACFWRIFLSCDG